MARPKKAITKAQIKSELLKKKTFKRKAHTDHFLSNNADYVCHTLDEDLIQANRSGKSAPGQDFFFGLMDEQLDSTKGTYYFLWQDNHIQALWESVLYRSLGILRYAGDDSDSLLLELNWICSTQFDDVCCYLGLDATAIRIEIPKILTSYGYVKSNDEINRLYDALVRYRKYTLDGNSSFSNAHLYSSLEES